VVGQAPLQATVYELESLRCNLCGEIFEAEAPPGVSDEKYDESTAAMIALLKYGGGVPFYRLAGLEENLGIPLPASTQWEIVKEVAQVIRPVFDELVRQAAQGEVFYNDDTRMKILALARASPRVAGVEEEASNSRERTGLFTSGIIATRQERQIALFFTGRPSRPHRFKCVMRCRGTCRSCRRNWKSSWDTVWPTAGAGSWTWSPAFPTSAGMYWKAWRRCTVMMPRHRDGVCHRGNDCAFTRSTAGR